MNKADHMQIFQQSTEMIIPNEEYAEITRIWFQSQIRHVFMQISAFPPQYNKKCFFISFADIASTEYQNGL